MRGVCGLCAFLLMMGFAKPDITITATPRQSFAPATVRITIHILRAPENRALVWGCDSLDGLATESEEPLNGEDSRATFEKTLKSLPAGEYECRAAIARGALPPVYATPVTFTVIPQE